MRLDAKDLRYVTPEEFRVLKAAETGSLSHEVVPSTLIASTSGLHHAGLNKIMSDLARRSLIAREKNIKYDGWRLTYGGYDWLAVRALREKDALLGVGTRMGVGKESDIYIAHLPPPTDEPDDLPIPAVLKVHRLGRISFRKIKEKRDYLAHRKSAPNWMYLSRLAAKKEWQFMQLLHEHGFPVPKPIAQSRHSILMSRIQGYPLRQIVDLPAEHVASLFASLMALIVRLARAGLIHGDFNEFNIMVREVKEAGDDEYEGDGDDAHGVWARPEVTQPGSKARSALQEERQLQPGERVEKGNGFERIYYDDTGDREERPAESDDEESASDGSSDEDEDDEEVEEFDGDGTNEALRIDLRDGTSIEPILIDFPQMVSVEHPNAEYYFDRDVDGVRSFFRKRFRFEGDHYPSFRDVVPTTRQKEREVRAARRARRAKNIKDGEVAKSDEDPLAENEQHLGLELDVLAGASGLGSASDCVSDLDQYMAALHVQNASDEDQNEDRGEEGTDSESNEGESRSGEDLDDLNANEVDARVQDGTLLPPSIVQPTTARGLAHQSRRRRETGEQGRAALARAARKVEQHKQKTGDADVDQVDARLSAERRSKARRDAKHHGKRAQAGKTGRAFGGGGSKAKSGDRALLADSTQF